MGENIDDEHFDNSPDSQSEITEVKIISEKDTGNINQNQETENMEVHHHTQGIFYFCKEKKYPIQLNWINA